MSVGTAPAPGAATFASGSGFLLDVERCTGCAACELACAIENDLAWGTSWRRVISVNPQRDPALPTTHLSLACQHCSEAPCAAACPAVAIARDAFTGAMLVDRDRCLGCRYCSWVCPYDAPRFADEGGTMAKCTGCAPRLGAGLDPACVTQCPTGALGFGPLAGATAAVGLPDPGIGAALRFDSGRPASAAPETTAPPMASDLAAARTARVRPPGRVSLAHEWPLLVFSLVAAALVGVTWGGQGGAGVVPAGLFGLAAVAAAGAATLHLGRPERAWRAPANVRRSWLSREIVAFGAFVATSTAAIALPSLGGLLTPVAMGLGFVTLFSIDRVYDPLRRSGGKPLHSADALLTGLLLAAILRDASELVAALTAAKLALVLVRLLGDAGDAGHAPPAALPASRYRTIGRIVAGLVVPLVPGVALAAFAIAEILDRLQFYEEVEARSPALEAHRAGPARFASASPPNLAGDSIPWTPSSSTSSGR